MIVWNYPITEEKHAEIRAELGKAKAPEGVGATS
jgi:Na+/melibiose symporter-like transporter